LLTIFNFANVQQVKASAGTALGNEVDIQVLCPIQKNVNMSVSYSMFFVGSAFKEYSRQRRTWFHAGARTCI